MSLQSDKASISGVFEAKRVAVVGASSKPGNLARRVVSNLLTLGFDGEVFPVGRSDKELLGLPVFRSVPDLPVAVDLAVIAVPALQVPSVLEECGQKGVRYATITSSGFGEYTEERSALDRQLLEIARKFGMRFLGPNCQGVRDYATGLCTRFGKQTREDALLNRVGLIVQSGTVSSTIERFLKAEGIGLTRLASIGNKLDVDEVDLLPVLLEHEATRMICMYLEGIRRGREFIEIAEHAEKPIVLLKGNIAPAAARIARSHSASILNEHRVMEAAARQAGIIQVTQLGEFPIVAKSFMLPPMRGNRLVIFSGSGGMGVVGADWAHRCGFDMPALEDSKARSIEKRLPGSYIKIDNPVDIGDFFDMQATLDMVDELLGDTTVDGMVVCIFDPTPGAVGFINVPARPFAVEIEELVKRHDKPVALVYAAERKVVEQAQLAARFPVFLTADEAIRGLAAPRDHWRMRRREREPMLKRNVPMTANPILDRSLAAAEFGLNYLEAFQVLEAAGIPVEMPHVALTAEAAVEIARSFDGAPVVLKAILEGGSHKTEADGVRLGVSGDDEVVAAFNDLKRLHSGATIVIQRMVSGLEFMVGSRRDPHFGPTVSVGPGGIFVELFDDLALRLAPVTQLEAQEMLQETRASHLLQGFRGKPPADAEALVETLQNLSGLVTAYPALSEIDINPLIVLPKGQGVRAGGRANVSDSGEMMDDKILSGKVALVGGGSGGIGSAVAVALAEAGADVALTYRSGAERARNVVEEIEKRDRRNLALEVDVRRGADVEKAVASVASELGSVDILVTAIGSGSHDFFMRQDESEWEEVWESDLRSIFYLSRAVLGPMMERKSGRVIFVSSDSGKVGNIGGAVSAAARGGIHAFTKSLAREMARDNITINAVCPGPTRTANFEERMMKAEGHMKYWNRVVKNIPLKRVAETREVASLVVYLASPDAGFITGQAISVSGGLTMV